MDNSKKSWIFALVAVALWSTVATAFKLTLQGMDYSHFLLFSSIASFIILFLSVRASGIKYSQFFTVPVMVKSALLGLINPFAYYLILFRAYELLPAQEAQPLNYLWPITVSFFAAMFLNQKLTKYNYAGLLISFVGVYVISTRGNIWEAKFSDPLGVSLAVASSLVWAAYWTLNLRMKENDQVKLAGAFMFGSIYTLVYLLATTSFVLPEPEYLAGCLYVGAFEMGITFLFWMKGMQYSSNKAITASLANLSPFLSFAMIVFLLGETMLYSSLIGLMFIIGGIFIQNIPRLFKI